MINAILQFQNTILVYVKTKNFIFFTKLNSQWQTYITETYNCNFKIFHPIVFYKLYLKNHTRDTDSCNNNDIYTPLKWTNVSCFAQGFCPTNSTANKDTKKLLYNLNAH